MPEDTERHEFPIDVFSLPRETEENAYAKFWGDKQRALWYVIVFSVVVNCHTDKLQTKVWKFPLPR